VYATIDVIAMANDWACIEDLVHLNGYLRRVALRMQELGDRRDPVLIMDAILAEIALPRLNVPLARLRQMEAVAAQVPLKNNQPA
jgi:hypothetical protein